MDRQGLTASPEASIRLVNPSALHLLLPPSDPSLDLRRCATAPKKCGPTITICEFGTPGARRESRIFPEYFLTSLPCRCTIPRVIRTGGGFCFKKSVFRQYRIVPGKRARVKVYTLPYVDSELSQDSTVPMRCDSLIGSATFSVAGIPPKTDFCIRLNDLPRRSPQPEGFHHDFLKRNS